MTEELEGLFTTIARAVHAAKPDALTQPLEIAEISARWAPYSRVRGELSLPTNEDYELLLMRLLAGEDGLVFADESLQDDLRREVASPNPDLTALRTYGAARVTLAREAVRRVLGLAADTLPAPTPDTRGGRIVAPPLSRVGDPTAPEPPSRAAPPNSCQFCGNAFPAGRTVHFCPHCGLNAETRRCPGCSADIQPGWRFCVTCGRAIGSRTK